MNPMSRYKKKERPVTFRPGACHWANRGTFPENASEE